MTPPLTPQKPGDGHPEWDHHRAGDGPVIGLAPSAWISNIADSSMLEVGASDDIAAIRRGLAADDDACAEFKTLHKVNSSKRWPHGGRQLSWVCHDICHRGWLNSGVRQAM